MTRAAVHSLDHFTLAVPDLLEAERFYRAFGLDVDVAPGRLRLRTFGNDHVWADVVGAERKKLLSLRFGAYAADLPALERQIGDARIDAPERMSNGIWLRSIDGLPIEIVAAEKTSPEEKGSFSLPARVSEHRGVGGRSSADQVKPRRLAHVAVFTADVLTTTAFLEDRLGLRLSDRSGNNVSFLHGAHGSDHHMVALARSAGPGLHHSSWDVATLGEVGLGAMQMARAGYTEGWGLGRHVLGSNYFHYVRDPWGSYAEYSADMDFIPAGVDWSAADHPGEDAHYQWGPQAPHDFGLNTELG
jgi:catechol 2,3-dioxygenase-like lactoylglutathione lyase family enzyme